MCEEYEDLARVRLELLHFRLPMFVANAVAAGPHDDLHALLELRKFQLHFGDQPKVGSLNVLILHDILKRLSGAGADATQRTHHCWKVFNEWHTVQLRHNG